VSIPIQVIRLSVIAAGVVAVVAFKTISSNIAEKQIDKALEELPQGLVTYESVSRDLFGFDVHINGITLNATGSKESTIDEIVIKSMDDEHSIPHYLDLEINGMDLDTNALNSNPRTAGMLELLGYEKLKADLAFNYEYDEDEKKIEIENVSLELEDAGELSIDAELHGIQALENLAMQMMVAPQSIKISKSSIKYEDDSLVSRLIKLNADQEGLSIDEFKKKVLSTLSEELKQAELKENKYEISMIEAVMEFFEDPDSFKISIEPEEAISLDEMKRSKNANEFMQKINLEICAN